MTELSAAERTAWDAIVASETGAEANQAMATILAEWVENPNEVSLDLDTQGRNTVAAYDMGDGNLGLILWFDEEAAEHITNVFETYVTAPGGSRRKEHAGDELDLLLASMLGVLDAALNPEIEDDEYEEDDDE